VAKQLLASQGGYSSKELVQGTQKYIVTKGRDKLSNNSLKTQNVPYDF
jgi:hypothetical protein